MPTDGLLTLIQWLSPSFPLGTFSYSHGLESAIADGRVRKLADLQDWIATVLTCGAGRNDAILLAEAWRAEDPGDIDALARALAVSRERLLETTAQGAAFCRTANAVWGMDLPPLSLPVAVGAAARMQGIALEVVLPVYLYAFAASLISAAQRCMALGQTDAQRIVADQSRVCLVLAQSALRQTCDDLGGSAFLADIAAMRHETLEPRIFRS